MKIKFLGTGTSQGIPVIGCDCPVCMSNDPRDKRLRNSLFVEVGNTNICIDAGPDFRQQMLRENIKKLDAILITHEHTDHIMGLDDIRGFNRIHKAPVSIFAEQRVQDVIRNVFAYAFSDDNYPGVPKMDLRMMNEYEKLTIGDAVIDPLRVYHYKLPILGFRINNMAYITDVTALPELTMKKLEGIDTLIVEALRHKPHVSHFSISQALELVELLKPRQTYFMHMNHHIGKHVDLDKELPEHVSPAYDGLELEL